MNQPPPGLTRTQTRVADKDTNESNYDEWGGYGGALFAGLKEDQEDRDADSCYLQVDEYLQGRRKQKQIEKVKELNKAY